MANRVTTTLASQRGYQTMVLDAVNAYLQVPETRDVFVIPPLERNVRWMFTLRVCGMLPQSEQNGAGSVVHEERGLCRSGIPLSIGDLTAQPPLCMIPKVELP